MESSFIHIIVQGINKEYIFQNDLLKEAYLNILKKNISGTDIKVIAYCVQDEKVIIEEFLKEKEKNISEIKENKVLLAELLSRLRYKGGLFLRAMEKILKISKSYLATIINRNLK